MTPQQLRDAARWEREYAATLITDENFYRAHGFDMSESIEASHALSRAAELERAAVLDEVSP